MKYNVNKEAIGAYIKIRDQFNANEWGYVNGMPTWFIGKKKNQRRGKIINSGNGDKKRSCIGINHNGKKYQLLAHRVAWFIEHGELPEEAIDHIDMNPLNNDISNLRLASQSQNRANSNIALGSSLYKGVSENTNAGKPWKSSITKDGKVEFLGYFECKVEAAEAYHRRSVELYGQYAPNLIIDESDRLTEYQKMCNERSRRRLGKSGHAGVKQSGNKKRFNVYYKNKFLGSSSDAKKAAIIWDRYAREDGVPEHLLNFPRWDEVIKNLE